MQLTAALPSFRRLELELYDTQMLTWREGLASSSVDPRVLWVSIDDAAKAKGWTDRQTLELLHKLERSKVAGVLLCGSEVFSSPPPSEVTFGPKVTALTQKQGTEILDDSSGRLLDSDGRMRSFPSKHRVVGLLRKIAARLGVDWSPSEERYYVVFSNSFDTSDVEQADSYLTYLPVDTFARNFEKQNKAESLDGRWIVLERTANSAENWTLETSRGRVGAGALFTHAINTVLEGWNLKRVEGLGAFLLTEFCLLGLTLLFVGRRPGTVFLWAILGLVSVAVGSLWAFTQGVWLPLGRLLLAVGCVATVAAVLGLRRANRVLASLGGSENARLEGRETEASILFTELPSYLTELEKAQSGELLAYRREYNGVLEAVARRHHGQILDYQGDFQMIGFGLRYDDDAEHALEASSAALEIVSSVSELASRWGVSTDKTRVHAGICTGQVALGHVGATEKQDVAAIGDTTNTAARILAAAIGLDREVLLAASTYTAAAGRLQGEALAPLELKGKSQAVDVYALRSVDAQWRAANLASKKRRIPSGGRIEYSPRTRGTLAVTLAFSAVAYLLGLLLGKTNVLLPWEWRLRDTVVNRFAPASSDPRIVLVGLDSESCADPRLGPLPWPRSAYAEAIKNLGRTGMSGVFLDVVFRQPSTTDPAGDEALRDALMSEPRASVAVTLERKTRDLTEPLFFLPEDQREILRQRNQLGIIHSSEDFDGVIRRTILAARATSATGEMNSKKTVLYPTGALTMLLDGQTELRDTGHGLLVGSLLIPSSTGDFPHELSLRFGPSATTSPPQQGGYRYVSFHRLLDPQDPIFEQLQGAYLFVGDTFAEGERFKVDRVNTPVGQIKGVEIHARGLDTLLNRSWIVPLPAWLEGLWSVLLAAFTTAVLARYRYFRDYGPRVLAVMTLHASVWLTSLLLFSRSLAFVVPILTILMICAAVLLGRYLLAFRALSWFLPKEVADELMLAQRTRDRRVTATVLLTDIRGYTSIAEGRSALAMLSLLNEYHKRTVACYARYGGQVLTYQGDAQIVVFGVFGRREHPAKDAVSAALELQTICDQLRQEWGLDGSEAFEVGAGLCTGVVEVGWLGGRENLQYSVVGETVRKTHKVQGLSAELQAPVLIDEETFRALNDEVPCDDLGEVAGKGLDGAPRLYRPKRSASQPGRPEEERNTPG